MKKLFVLSYCVLFVGFYNVCAQIKQLNNAPLYELGGQSSLGLAYFEDENIQDSLKVFFKVNVSFKYEIQADIPPQVVSVNVLEMKAINLQESTYPMEFILTSKNHNCYGKYQYLWCRFVPYIVSWYEKLHYEKMKISNYSGLKTITFTGVFVLVPIQSNR